MPSFKNTLAKGTLATVAAGAMAMGSAVPAEARHDDDGISAGEVIAGAVILGGLAAVIASADNDRDYRYNDRDYRYRDGDYRYNDRDYRYNDRNYRNNGYNGGNARQAVEQCVRTAERQAQRYTGRDAEVYEIRDIDRERRGFEIKGRIAVQDGYYRGYRQNYRRNYNNNGWDEGTFKCDVRNGRVVDLDFNGIRNLR